MTCCMNEYQKALSKIESWCDRIPYKSLRIEIELPNQTLILEKMKQNQIGFVDSGEKVGDSNGKKRIRKHDTGTTC